MPTKCGKKVAFFCICRNESHIIHECLESVAPYVDGMVITDTGSTDGTQDIIKKFCAERNLPCDIVEMEWVNFGVCRTASLRNAENKGYDYGLCLDADDKLVGDFKYPTPLVCDGAALTIQRGSFLWHRHQLFKLDGQWSYKGPLHEYAASNKPNARHEKIGGNYHIEARTIGARNVGIDAKTKYSRDAELLEKHLKEDPTDARSQFYLAQSYFDSEQFDKAFGAYEKRSQMQNSFEEEAFYSIYRMAIISVITQRPWEQTASLFLSAWAFRPIRAEPLFELARLYRMAGQPRLGYLYAQAAARIPFPQHDILFLEPSVYDWRITDEIAAGAFFVHDFEIGLVACQKLMANKNVDKTELPRIHNNFKIYQQHVVQLQAQQMQMKDAVKKQEKERILHLQSTGERPKHKKYKVRA